MSDNLKITKTYDVEIDKCDLRDIMITALEGGITYWADATKPVGEWLGKDSCDHVANGGILKIHLTEGAIDDSNKTWYEIDKAKLLKGIKMYLDDPETPFGILRDGTCGECHLELCEVDGAVADIIIQYALFGEVVFG